MNEREAIDALLAEIQEGDQANEELETNGADEREASILQDEANAQNTQDTEQENKQDATQSAQAFSLEQLTQALAEALKQNEANKASTRTDTPQANEGEQRQAALLEQLGLGNLAQMQGQLNELMAGQAKAQEQARAQAVFNQNSASFEKEFPTIKLEELGKFAEANGFMQFLGEDYNGWKLVAKAMLNVATPKQEPDAITGNGGGGNEISAFERLKKGEDVSDIELGAELLKGV